MANEKPVKPGKQTRTSRAGVKKRGNRPGNNGKGARNAAMLARQERHFDLNVLECKTIRQISAITKHGTDTIIKDIRAEEQRRSSELAVRRENEKSRAVEFYQEIIRKALERHGVSGEIIQKILTDPKFDGKVTDRSLQDALAARERIDKVLGVDAPSKVDIGMQQLVDALTAGGDDRAKPLE